MTRRIPPLDVRGLPEVPWMTAVVVTWIHRLERRHDGLRRWHLLVERGRSDVPPASVTATVAVWSATGSRLVFSHECTSPASTVPGVARLARTALERVFKTLDDHLREHHATGDAAEVSASVVLTRPDEASQHDTEVAG